MLIADFNRTGAYIVVATCALRVPDPGHAVLLRHVPVQARTARLATRLRALRTAWAHFRETRRKERMRREVIRKHTQKEAADGSAARASPASAG